jgi:hypothetical protein
MASADRQCHQHFDQGETASRGRVGIVKDSMKKDFKG